MKIIIAILLTTALLGCGRSTERYQFIRGSTIYSFWRMNTDTGVIERCIFVDKYRVAKCGVSSREFGG